MTAERRSGERRGAPTPEEAAAVVAVLWSSQGGPAPLPTAPSGWRRAARLEATGAAPVGDARDPRLARRPSGALPPGAA